MEIARCASDMHRIGCPISGDRTALMRLGVIFVAICMVIIAGSAGAISFLYLGVSASEAATVAVATLTALALYNTVSTRIGLRSTVGHQLAELSRAGAEQARQVAELGRRLAAMERPGRDRPRSHAGR